MKKYIFTGGPGNGKTTLLTDLEKLGFAIVEEVPRAIINEEKKKKEKDINYKPIIPEYELEKFQVLVINRQIELESKVKGEIAFLDRSLVDPVAYATLGNVYITPEIYGHIKNANYTKAFLLDMLPEYKNDEVRWESRDYAEKLHKAIEEAYKKCSIEIVRVPPFGRPERLEFILSHIK